MAGGAISEIVGLQISLYLLIPGAIFEVAIAFWLIFKGFNAAAATEGAPAISDGPTAGPAAAPVAVGS